MKRLDSGIFVRSCVLALSAWLAGAAQAQIAKMELHALPSITPTDAQFLLGSKEAPAVTLGAELRIPRPGPERLPAAVILHGSGGHTDREDLWARELNAMGVATLLVDSFTARGIATTIADQDQLSRLAMVVDAYRALDLLARHPRIDASRVLLIGFSRGGGAAHWAAIRRFQQLHGTPGRQFAGYLAFYPTCNRRFDRGLELTDAPIRILHGTADDYIPIGGCRVLVEELQGAGHKEVRLMAYEGAHHGFDNAARKAPVKPAQAQTTRGCPLIVETAGGVLVNAQSRVPFSYKSDPCVERGTTLAFDAPAYEGARAVVREMAARLMPAPR